MVLVTWLFHPIRAEHGYRRLVTDGHAQRVKPMGKCPVYPGLLNGFARWVEDIRRIPDGDHQHGDPMGKCPITAMTDCQHGFRREFSAVVTTECMVVRVGHWLARFIVQDIDEVVDRQGPKYQRHCACPILEIIATLAAVCGFLV